MRAAQALKTVLIVITPAQIFSFVSRIQHSAGAILFANSMGYSVSGAGVMAKLSALTILSNMTLFGCRSACH